MQISAKIHEITPVINVTESFKKRELIVEYAENPSYPEHIKFEIHQDKVTILDNYKPGDLVDIHFNLRGRPWTDKNGKTVYFNTLVCWKIGKQEGGQQSEQAPNTYVTPQSEDEPDGLPF